MAIPTYFRSGKTLGTLTLTYLYKFILKLGKICFIKGRKQLKVTNYNNELMHMKLHINVKLCFIETITIILLNMLTLTLIVKYLFNRSRRINVSIK